jgi:hypothetical protein
MERIEKKETDNGDVRKLSIVAGCMLIFVVMIYGVIPLL